MAITLKTHEDIEGMRVAGRLASEVLDMLTPHVKPGVTTLELDKLAHDYIVNVQGAVPATLNYAPPGYPPYPASLCASINDQVCHGIPDERPLRNGDIVNIDVTVIKDGWHGDNSRMYLVGETTIAARRLCAITFEAMWKGIVKVRPGAHLGDVGHAIQTHAENNGYSVVREFCGHGVGRRFHEEPRHARGTRAGHDLHDRADDQRRQARHQGRPQGQQALRRLDHRHQGSFAVCAVGAHGAGHRDRLRRADPVFRQPAAA
jgi:methionyl aminopeptidase